MMEARAAGSRISGPSCVYIDSPMPNAIDQVLPFYRSGFFDTGTVPLYLRRRFLAGARRTARSESLPPISRVRRFQPAQHIGGRALVFYPFAAMANAQLVSDRSVQHILTLHGESNKLSSFRAAARLYDYVLVAGDLACRRYVQLKIFSEREVERGRLVRMGDTLVQDMPFLAAAADPQAGWLLYAPTWETSTPSENYSSAEDGYGFAVLERCAAVLGARRILLKPHPNFGMKNPAYVLRLVAAIRRLRALGHEVRIIDDAVNRRIRLAATIAFGTGIFAPASAAYPISLALVDISGMEAICLKQTIPHLVIRKASNTHAPEDASLGAIYARKAIAFGADAAALEARLTDYVAAAAAIDDDHRKIVFSYSESGLAARSTADRFAWLDGHIRDNAYWG